MNTGAANERSRPGDTVRRLVLLVAGILVGQSLLYGPSLVGKKVLLPLDVLAAPSTFVPHTPETPNGYPRNLALQDLVLLFEPERLFAARELHQGRLPLWIPHQYGGVPFIWPKYSPFCLLTCLTESPIWWAWAQLLAALVAGTGAYAFCRGVLRVGFWPSTFAAWCYPMTGFLVLWRGFPTCAAVYWFPWLLLAVDRTIRGNRMASPALAFISGLVLVSGHIDVAGQVLLVAGMFALWCLWDVHRPRLFSSPVAKGLVVLAAAWGLGLMLAAPHVLPLLEYARTGARVIERAAGLEERPPLGLAALPQMLFPEIYGSTQRGSFPLYLECAFNLQECPASAYTGLLATLVVAPLAWYSRRHRSINLFWALLMLLGLSWSLNVPGIVDLLRLPGLRLLSHNRLAFATSFAILASTAIGLDAIRHGLVRWDRRLWLQLALLIGLCGWWLYRSEVLSEWLTAYLERVVQSQGSFFWVFNEEAVKQAQSWFILHHRVYAAWCAIGAVIWLLLRFRHIERASATLVVGTLLVVDLLGFSYGQTLQCDPALYFPKVPALQSVAAATSDRVIGYKALPADLAQVVGLKDVRGYDSIDPARWLSLLRQAADEQSKEQEYARVQWFIPKVRTEDTNALGLSPILDMLGVQYVILRGTPKPGVAPAFQSPDYWVLKNPSALPRAFVPRRIEVISTRQEMLRRLGGAEFDPRSVAFVETLVTMPAECRGTVTITEEIPSRVLVKAQMETPGLLVLADAWDRGWRAYVNGRREPILRTNYALRGVAVPEGSATIEFRYQPASVSFGFWSAGVAAAILSSWFGLTLWAGSKTSTAADDNPGTS